MAGSFIWYELMTPDPDAAKNFYDAVVGWVVDPSGHVMPTGAEYRMIRRSDGVEQGGMLRLSDEMREHGARPIWLGYIEVDDVDATITAIKTDGGQVHMEAFDIPNVGRLAMVTDPVGVPFYVMTPVSPPGQPDAKSDSFHPEKAQHVRWNELSTTDQDGAIGFFGKHFGWTQDGGLPMGALGEYKFVNHGGAMIGAIMPKCAEQPLSAWIYYIGVDDIDRAVAAIRDGGGKLVHEPMEIPGGEFSVAAFDPQGAAFGLVGPRKS